MVADCQARVASSIFYKPLWLLVCLLIVSTPIASMPGT